MTSEHSIEKGKYMKSILFEHTLGFAGPTKNSKKISQENLPTPQHQIEGHQGIFQN